MKRLKAKGIEVVVYEPEFRELDFYNSRIETDIGVFKDGCDIILANRMVPELEDVLEKVFTRDIYGSD